MNTRIKYFIALNIIFILLWIGYLFSIQILDAHKLKATVQIRQNPSKEILIPNRGNIYDRDGELLVSSVKYYQIDVDRRAIIDNCNRESKLTAKKVFNKIAKIISDNSLAKKDFLFKKLTKKPQYSSIYLISDVSENQLHIIKREFAKENIKGLVVSFSNIKRLYPHDKLGANFLGIIDAEKQRNSGNSIYTTIGRNGIEATYNKYLCGEIGWRETIYDANNRMIPLLFLKEKAAQPGKSIYLTINKEIQEILEEKLIIGLKKYKAKNAIGIVMEPNTGEILAMAGLAKGHEERSANELRSVTNIAASFMFEPGSSLKPITALLALEKDIYKPPDIIDCTDYHLEYESEERVIKDDHKYKTLSFKDIIAYSSNVGISRIVEKIGSKVLYERLIAMGFGHKTGSNISGEASGIFRKLKDWQGFSLHSISFGQEISVSTLQLANAYCSLANGGNVMQPHLVKEIRDENNKIITSYKTKILRKISNKRSLDTLKVFLKSVVDYGTATGTKFEHLTIAGKTGTSEKATSGKIGYEEEKYTSVFAGFFPVKKPEYVIVIVYDEADYKSYSYYASLSAVPTFRDVVKKIVNLPDTDVIANVKEDNKKFVFAPNVTGLQLEKAIKILQKKEINFIVTGENKNGTIMDQYPKPNTSFDKNEKIILNLDNKQDTEQLRIDVYAMPNLIGLTLRKAIAISNKSSVKLVIHGNGIISAQSIKPGSNIKFGDVCTITAK
ncbi:MAG: penicillin-binding transpeptidase domain-containing protein [Candidatus Tenebribacter burtonii]|jgi:cell division protein FtsI/penicillin-binding protein 2|nr:penicillin-binding transpeptidase domain-containing protein [Candidatus Tenebribacter burtonii]